MNHVDIVLILILALGVWSGFKKGFIVSLFDVIGLGLGVYGGIHFSDAFAEWLKTEFNIGIDWLPFSAFLVTLLLILLVVHLLAKAITKALKLAMLGTVNKVGGAVFGLARSVLFLSLALLFIHPLNKKSQFVSDEALEASVLYTPIYLTATTVIPALLTSDFFEYLDENDWIPLHLRDALEGNDELSLIHPTNQSSHA
ncbi:MAG: CvpA family protein [Flavobacteriales bacterium]|jgi:membrane protein required for colicin V production